MKEVLFVCTGNYYRSRYSEALFNHLAEEQGLSWRGFSRGLAIHLAEGDLSYLTRDALGRLGIGLHHTGPTRVSLCKECLERAARILVIDEREHRPYMLQQFPEWVERVEYWDCGDIQFESSDSCLPRLEEKVRNLVDTIVEWEQQTPKA